MSLDNNASLDGDLPTNLDDCYGSVKSYDARFRDIIDLALADIGFLDRREEIDTKDEKPVSMGGYKVAVRRLLHSILKGKIIDERTAYTLFWKKFEKLKSEFLQNKDVDSTNDYVKMIFEIFNEAKSAINESRDYIKGALFTKQDENSEVAEVIQLDPEFLRLKKLSIKHWKDFLGEINNYKSTSEKVDLDEFEYIVVDLAGQIESDLSSIVQSIPEELPGLEEAIYRNLMDVVIRLRGEVNSVDSFRLILGILEYLNSAIPPVTDNLRKRLKALIIDSDESVKNHPDYKPAEPPNKGKVKIAKKPVSEKPKPTSMPTPIAKPVERQPKPKRKPMYVLKPKNKPLYRIQLMNEMGAEHGLLESFERAQNAIPESMRERADQILRFVLFAFTNAVIDLIVQVEHATGDIPLKNELKHLRSRTGMVDVSRIQTTLVRDLSESLCYAIKRNASHTNIALVAFGMIEGSPRLERAFAQTLVAIFNTDMGRAQKLCIDLGKMDIIDLNSKINFNKFANSRFTMSDEPFTFDDVKEAVDQIVFCLQGVEYEREELVQTPITQPKGTYQRAPMSVRRPGDIPRRDLELIEEDLLVFLKKNPLYIHDSLKMQAKAEELAQDLNDAYYNGSKRYISTTLLPHIVRISKKLIREHDLISVETEPAQPETAPPADFLADFAEWEKEEIRKNQEWMEKIIQIHPAGSKLTFEKMLIHAIYEAAYKPDRLKDLSPSQIRLLTAGLTQLRDKSGDFNKKGDKESWSIKDFDSDFLGAILTQLLDSSRGSVSVNPNVNQVNDSLVNQQQVIKACDEELRAIDQQMRNVTAENKKQKLLTERAQELDGKISVAKEQIYHLQQKQPKYGTPEFVSWMNTIESLDRDKEGFEMELEQERKKLIDSSSEHRKLDTRKAKVKSQKQAAMEKAADIQIRLVALLHELSGNKK